MLDTPQVRDTKKNPDGRWEGEVGQKREAQYNVTSDRIHDDDDDIVVLVLCSVGCQLPIATSAGKPDERRAKGRSGRNERRRTKRKKKKKSRKKKGRRETRTIYSTILILYPLPIVLYNIHFFYICVHVYIERRAEFYFVRSTIVLFLASLVAIRCIESSSQEIVCRSRFSLEKRDECCTTTRQYCTQPTIERHYRSRRNDP